MNDDGRIETVVRYMVHHHKRLKGAMPEAKYFVALGRETRPDEQSLIIHGTGVDALAYLIERRKFFGSKELPGYAISPSNAKVDLLDTKDSLTGRFDVRVGRQGVCLMHTEAERKDYLNPLRTQQGFLEVAENILSERNLEDSVSALFKADMPQVFSTNGLLMAAMVIQDKDREKPPEPSLVDYPLRGI